MFERIYRITMDAQTIKALLTATGDSVRLEIMLLLGEQRRLHVTAIAAHFTLSRPAISHHLKVLRDANVVKSEKVGQEVFYWLNHEYVIQELRALADRIADCVASND